MTFDAPHILVVDDDTRLRALLRKFLSEQGFRVTDATDAADARSKMVSLAFDLMVLDVMMPGENGLDLIRSFRPGNNIPVLLLTARGESEDRIAGLECGADDYLAKPFEPRELVLRVNAILRRTQELVAAVDGPTDGIVRFGDFSFDPVREELLKAGAYVRLTAAESSLLKALAQRPGEAMDRDALSAESPVIGSGRAIDVQVTRLRRKIEENPKFPRYLRAVRGVGYSFVPD